MHSETSDDSDVDTLDAYFESITIDTNESPQPLSVVAQRQSLLKRFTSLFGIKNSDSRPRRRRENNPMSTVPAMVEHLKPRVLMSGTPVSTAIDAAHWNNPTDGAQAEIIPQAGTYFHDFDLNPKGTEFVTTNKDGSLTLYDAVTGAARLTVGDHSSYCNDVEYSPDGTKIATAGSDKTVNLRDAQTGVLLQTFQFSGNCGTVAFSSDGSKMAVGVYGQGIHVIDVKTGSDRSVPYAGEVPFSAFSADGTTLAVSGNKSIVLYDTTTLQQTKTLTGLTDNPYCVSFNPTGHWIAAGDNAGHIGIWDTTTGELKALTSDLKGKPNAAGGVWNVAFTNSGLGLGAADYTGNIVMYDVSNLAKGTLPSIASQFQTAHNTWGLTFSSTDQVGMLTALKPGDVSIIQTFAVPKQLQAPAVPPVVVIPTGNTTDTSNLTGTPDANIIIADLAHTRMNELTTSIDIDASQLPALLRRKSELDSAIAAGTPIIAKQQATVNKLQTDYTNATANWQNLKKQYDDARRRGDGRTAQKLETTINGSLQIVNGIAPNLNNALTVLNNMLASDQSEKTEQASVISLINTLYTRLSTQSAEYVACGQLAGIDVQTVTVQANDLVRTGVQEGESALTHVRPTVTILDKNVGNGTPSIKLLDKQIAEIHDHPAAIGLSRMQVTGRIRNNGDREGYVTVNVGGTSDTHPDLLNPQTLTVFLKPGQERDFVAIVDIPLGSNGQRGSASIKMTSPDEDAVIALATQANPRSVGTGSYVQGEGAVYHNSQIIATTDGTGTVQQRMQNYLAANPTEAASIAQKLSTGALTADSAFKNIFIAAQQAAVTVAQQKAGEAISAINAMQQSNLDPTSKAVVLSSLFARADGSFWASAGISDTQGTVSEAAKQAYTTVMSMTQRELFVHVQGWYEQSYGYLRDALATRTDTVMGKILLGASEQLWSATTEEHQWEVAISLQEITGISAQKFFNAYQQSSSVQIFGANIRTLMTAGQYGELFGGYNISNLPYITEAHPNIPASAGSYTGGNIRIRFDLFTNGNDIRRVDAVMSDGTVLAETAGAMFIDIPIEKIGKSEDGLIITIKVKLLDGTEISKTCDAINVRPNSTNTIGSIKLSTSSEPVQADFENKVLNAINFPVQSGGWTYLIGSSAHKGRNLFALDLSKEGDTDSPVTMAATGYIDSINLDDGRVIVRHQTDDGRVWFTQYEHMTHILESVTGINYIGKTEAISKQMSEADQNQAAQNRAAAQSAINVYIQQAKAAHTPYQQGLPLAKVGNEGEYTTGSHIHFAVYDENDKAIDTSHWANVQQPGIIFIASIGTKINLSFVWNDSANAFVYNAEHIALKRVDVKDAGGNVVGTENLAYAWEEGKTINEMSRIRWDQSTGLWYEIDINGNLVTNTGKNHVWMKNSSTNKFEFIWQ